MTKKANELKNDNAETFISAVQTVRVIIGGGDDEESFARTIFDGFSYAEHETFNHETHRIENGTDKRTSVVVRHCTARYGHRDGRSPP